MADQPFGSSSVWHTWDVPPLTFGSTDSAIQLTAPPPPQSILRLEPRVAMSRPPPPPPPMASTGAFQPRVVTGTLLRDQGGWGPSQSPSRMRAPSLLGSLSPPHQPEIVSAAPMQRPAYLEQSALRRFLQLDHRPPEHAVQQAVRSSSVAPSFTTDSEDDYGAREVRGTPTPEPRLDHISGSQYDGAIRVPTRWNPDDKHPSLVLSADGREVRYPSPTQRTDKEAAAIRANYPMPPACGVYYFEVEIIEKGAQGHIGIGFSTSKVQLSRLPGWEPFSWGYHGDDGNSFAGQSEGTPYGPVFGTGDVIGCGVDFTEGRAFYTKNGEFLKKVFRDLKGELYPSVGLRTPKERVLANFGQQPFRFDIATYVMQQRDRVWRNIQRTPLDVLANPRRIVRAEAEAAASGSPEREVDVLRRPLRALVLSYLTHHGYSGTARALRSATITPPISLSEDTSMEEERQVERELELESDTAARQRIVRAVSVGDIDSALAEIESRYHKFVAADRDGYDEETGMGADADGDTEATSSIGMVMFRLRCRKLVEMVLAAEGDDLDGEASPDTPTRHSLALKGKDKGKGKASRDSMDLDGDVDMSSSEPASGRGLAAALEYGQFLHQKYGKDRRPGVAAELRAAAGLVAYTDPRAALGPAGALVGPEARAKLADEVNRVILSSQGLPEHTALESVFRQTSAVTDTLAREGVGRAAFADVDREFGSSADFGDGRGAIGLRLVEG